MITEDYVSFEIAKLLKEKGFNVNTLCKYVGKEGATEKWYDDYRERMLTFNWDEGHLIEPLTEPEDKYGVYGDTIPAPTMQMVMKWLREVHNIAIETEWEHLWYAYIKPMTSKPSEKDYYQCESPKYEEACESAIKYCLENLI